MKNPWEALTEFIRAQDWTKKPWAQGTSVAPEPPTKPPDVPAPLPPPARKPSKKKGK